LFTTHYFIKPWAVYKLVHQKRLGTVLPGPHRKPLWDMIRSVVTRTGTHELPER